MQIYFSHSYRDVAINNHFLGLLNHEELPLRADQKTDVWCVAKLERYMTEASGFISIIPRRATDKDPGGYSPYIARELDLARRARVPRLLFVDELVRDRHGLDFPKDAIPFRPDDPARGQADHAKAIRAFTLNLDTSRYQPREYQRKRATLVVGASPVLRDGGQELAELLRRRDYSVTLVASFRERGWDDVRLLEGMWQSELCVFLLGDRLSEAHLALAQAHAHGIPSIRLQQDRRIKDPETGVSGVIRWHRTSDMLVEASSQVESFEKGLIVPLDAQSVATMERPVREEDKWSTGDREGLVAHIHPEHGFVQDEVNRVRREFGKSIAQSRDRSASMEICRLVYGTIWRHRYAYEWEPAVNEKGVQAIRTPRQIETHKTATCLDLACLFAAILEGAGQRALVVIVDGPSFAHALVGYIALDEPSWNQPTMGDLRRAVQLGDAVLFEPTGAVEAEKAVGEETGLTSRR